MPPISTLPPVARRADVVVAGSGIVGLSVAWESVRRGYSVVVVERDAGPVGASVRNFGHGCVTAQLGAARMYGEIARSRWLQLRDEAGLWVQETGAVVVARSDEEFAVLREFVQRNPESVRLMQTTDVLDCVPVAADEVVGGAYLLDDLRIDPRTAVPAFVQYLARLGVHFVTRTNALAAEEGVLHTNRGDIKADKVVLALGHDLDQLLPEPCAASGFRRCQLHMLRVAAPEGRRFGPAVLTGSSLLRYEGFLACPSSGALLARAQAETPALLAAGVNLMFTQEPSGDLLIGDTHAYGTTPSPFSAEELDELILDETKRLLGVAELRVRERWLGVYASTPTGSYLTPCPASGVVGVAVTSGIGMTTALGLAPAVLDHLDS